MNEQVVTLVFKEPQIFSGHGRQMIIRFDFTAVDSRYLDSTKEIPKTRHDSIEAGINDTSLHSLENLIRGDLLDLPDGKAEAAHIKKVLQKYLFHLFLSQNSEQLGSGKITSDKVTLKAPAIEHEREVAIRIIRHHHLLKDPSDEGQRRLVWVPDLMEIREN